MVDASPSPSLVCLSKRHRHHGDRAGYNQILRYLEPDFTVWALRSASGRVVHRISKPLLGRVTGSRWYGLSSMWGELRSVLAANRGPATIHVMYAEDLLGLLPQLLRQRPLATRGPVRTIATFHQPPKRITTLFRKLDVLDSLDGIIVLDPSNAAWFEARTSSPVHTLSLGIDTDYWSPGPQAPSPGPEAPDVDARPRILFVGIHLRDFDLLAEVIARNPDWHFDLVLPANVVGRFANAGPRVTTHTGISDDALRSLFRRTTAFFMPVLGASGSNSILQALACGAVIVTSDVPSFRALIGPNVGRLAPISNVDAHESALRSVIEAHSVQRQAWSRAARASALRFGLDRVAADHRAVYARLHAASTSA